MRLGLGRKERNLLKVYSLLLIVPVCLVVSCNRHKSVRAKKIISTNTTAQDFADQLSAIYKPIDTVTIQKDLKDINKNIRYAYQLNEYLPVWLVNDKPSKSAEAFLTDLEEVQWDGLDPEKYQLSDLRKKLDAIKNDKKSNISALIAFDTAFTRSYLKAASDLLMGAIVPKIADSLWYHKNDTLWNAPQVLASEESYHNLDAYRSTLPTYALLRAEYKRYADLAKNTDLSAAIVQVKETNIKRPDSAALAAITTVVKAEVPWADLNGNDTVSAYTAMLQAYQEYIGLKPNGKLDSTTISRLSLTPGAIQDKLKANMERVRWMPKDFGNTYIFVDIPLAELFFRKDGQDVMHMRTVVGKTIRQTPSLGANMANVVINPPWGVPPTILKKDVLPGIAKSGQKYLAQKGLKAYDRKGNKINGASVTPKNYRNYTFKQDPGDDNSLGYVKFNLPNPWDIYLHDTPHRDDFVKSYRALSSGCVRLQQPQQMAIYILAELEKKKFTQEILDSMIQTHKTRWEILKNKIPVHIVYMTAFEDSTGKHLRMIRDVYEKDEKLISMLK